MNEIIIRPFTKADRASIRTLCCDVADRGKPIEKIFPDREVAGDLLTKYYTDFEPESSFVAVCDNQLVGYINGCMDNRRYGLVMFWLLMPALIVKAYKHGLFFRREIHQLLQASLKNWRRIFVWRKSSFHSHQGHLHIGIANDFRGRQLGRRLVNTLLNYAKLKGKDELAASVHEANSEARDFFEKLGFVVKEQYPMIMIREGHDEHYHSLLYVKSISTY